MRIFLIFFAVYLYAFEIIPIHYVKYNTSKAKLGEKLFFDKRLSKYKDISCASCHNLKRYGVDNRRFSIGTGGVVDKPMNSLSVYNVIFNAGYFWNGRSETLEEQVISSLTDKKEHNLTVSEIENVVRSEKKYVQEFEKIYHKKPSINEIANAIAEFEKSLITPNSKFDKYLLGRVKLSKQETRGYYIFKMYGCITCHNGINVGSNSYQKLGIFLNNIKFIRGLDRSYVTKSADDMYVYRVPSLRNVEKTYPYFHDGSVKTLKEAIKLMGELNLGINIPAEDINDIEVFLKTLTGEIKR
ncbi:cytochrome c551 peroxidase [Nautilia profundicola AmH]|uniref:Cytochrome c551 peroxidase n=1 Tax=Nautilia profundicola (strain ATCC BAA-1463 / DSM 18972 / AmH) TaxID=598659 RepID=B9L8X8_NAUPA|nr:cytochrome c peroxidase [Nautilia profundicola]ACM93320.1 cytochrome c551 peroxidase [Nautilia profundicola AmH]